MSPLITWHGAGTASLQSGILTEWSWNWWRCAAAVNCGYRLVREGGRREERHWTDWARWARVGMEIHKTPNFFLPSLMSLLFHLIPSFHTLVFSEGFIPLLFYSLPNEYAYRWPFESSILHHKGIIMHLKCSPGEAFFPEKRIERLSGWTENRRISLTDKMSNYHWPCCLKWCH